METRRDRSRIPRCGKCWTTSANNHPQRAHRSHRSPRCGSSNTTMSNLLPSIEAFAKVSQLNGHCSVLNTHGYQGTAATAAGLSTVGTFMLRSVILYALLTRAAGIFRPCIILRLWSSVLRPELPHLSLGIPSWFTHRYVSSSMNTPAPRILIHLEQRFLSQPTSTCHTATFY